MLSSTETVELRRRPLQDIITFMALPIIIQGGMGVGVSNWNLARKVSQLGQLGVVSGALLAVVFARRLQDGDADGSMRRAMANFPFPAVAERVLEEYFIEGGKPANVPYASCPMPVIAPGPKLMELTVAASFAEVFLAKEGHEGQVGINLLEKIQLTTLPLVYGSMLAGVDAVLMGAGIPRAVPGVLDRFAAGDAADLKIDVDGAAPGEEFRMHFDPKNLFPAPPTSLKRPEFLAIVSSATLATSLAKKSSGKVNGFVIEADVAGGHNAPPRGAMQLSADGEPIYGVRDQPDFPAFRALGLPFWLAGMRATPEGLREAKELGAVGIQVGTAFAFCTDSGLRPDLRKATLKLAAEGKARVFTDPLASPTGFPFKVVQMEGTLSGEAEYAARPRICDLGYLRQAYKKADGSLGYRCASEPEDAFIRKGGKPEECIGRKCLCNGLSSSIGQAQIQKTGIEPDIMTAGNDVTNVTRFIPAGREEYTAEDVIRYLLS